MIERYTGSLRDPPTIVVLAIRNQLIYFPNFHLPVTSVISLCRNKFDEWVYFFKLLICSYLYKCA